MVVEDRKCRGYDDEEEDREGASPVLNEGSWERGEFAIGATVHEWARGGAGSGDEGAFAGRGEERKGRSAGKEEGGEGGGWRFERMAKHF